MAADLGATMQALYRQFGELPGVSIELHKELLAVRIDNAKASATVFLQGAQLSQFQRRGEPPLIWCSAQCDYRTGVPLRGGIPVCWPWFGVLDKNPPAVQKQISGEAAAHGFVRKREWSLADIQQPNPNQTQLIFTLTLQTGEEPQWPHATRLTLALTIGETLEVAFTVQNLSDQTVSFSSALHSYFAVGNIEQASLDGLQDLTYLDCLKEWTPRQQQGVLSIDQEVDRIYHGTAKQPIRLADSAWQRVIEVACSGSDSAVIWNPWIEKSRHLSHFADTAYRDMLCIETANADNNFVQLQPSQQHQMTVSISSRPLN